MTLDTGASKAQARSQKHDGTGLDAHPESEEAATPPGFTDEKFRIFYTSEMPKLVNYLKAKTRMAALAEDIAQESMIQLAKHWGEVLNPKAWTYKVAGHVLYRHQARASQKLELLTDSILETPTQPPPQETLEELSDIIEVIRELPERQREVFAWYADGYSAPEIAELLNLTPSTVRSNIRHARIFVSKRMKETRPGLQKES
ncbi:MULTISPECIES: RNA polymerase sigma factor [Streptomyces]|uniref:RNA polymerase sigma factor n=1 Tax=Streptomyces TaxID=1883 RepID=UPI002E0DE867|nr:sigma-70 family RNA polymerase sigma factor [Streptomyces sp. NBC_01208]